MLHEPLGRRCQRRALAGLLCVMMLATMPLWAEEGASTSEAQGTATVPAGDSQTKDEQLRQIQIEQARQAMNLAKTLMDRKKKDWEELQKLAAQDIVTGQEVNQAEEQYKTAEADYEQTKLELRRTEIDSMRDAWHISITDTQRRETADGRDMLSIRLMNDSEAVKLRHTSEILGQGTEAVVSGQIDDIFVSIQDRYGSIIAQPYETRIPSLGSKEGKSLEFELLKEDVQDVIVELKYLDIVEQRNIHLRQEEPYISVLNTRRYKDPETGKRHLELKLRYGAVEESTDAESSPDEQITATEISNIYVSIRDETDSIIGLPYEIKIPSLQYQQEVTLDYELRKNTNYVTTNLRYLDREIRRQIYLEPDTRHISILSAVKSRREGNIMVALELQNTTKGELPSPTATPDEIAAANDIRGVYVSLLENGVIIAQPYEYKIDVLEYNEIRTLTFQLQRDVDAIEVSLDYKDTGTEMRNVYLQKESAEDIVNISSLSFSQEGNLGSNVNYDLLLDRLAENERTFQLRVINLNEKFSFEFTDRATQSRVAQVKFTMQESRRNLSLIVYLPEELDINMLDKKIVFHAAVVDNEEAKRLGSNQRLTLSEEEISQIKGGVERLELVPRGVPELELLAHNLYFDIKKEETVEMSVRLKNTGTRDLDDIRVEVTSQPDWTVLIDPMIVKSLPRSEERTVQLTLTPALDVTVGDYEATIEAYCTVDNQKVEALEKTVRIHILPGSRLGVTGILVGFVILMVIGISVLTIRVARR